jgi:nitric oxide synthase-interacting protein
MPSKHSKNAGDKHHFTYSEKQRIANKNERFGTDAQIPFGYCCLSLHPTDEAVVTPSGHLYDREAILEYLLTKTKEIRQLERAYEEQQVGSLLLDSRSIY